MATPGVLNQLRSDWLKARGCLCFRFRFNGFELRGRDALRASKLSTRRCGAVVPVRWMHPKANGFTCGIAR